MKLGKTRVQRLHRLFFVYSSWNPLKVVGGFFLRIQAKNCAELTPSASRRRSPAMLAMLAMLGPPAAGSIRGASDSDLAELFLVFFFVFFLVIFSGVSAFDCFFFFCDGRLGTTSETLAQRCRRRTKSTTASCNAEARSYPLPQRRH